MARCVWRSGVLALLISAGGMSAAGIAQQAPFHLEFATYLGGSGSENFRDVAVDAEGNIYVTGGTSSPDFPTTPGAFDRSFAVGGTALGTGGPMDVFVAKLSPAGQLTWSTYVGGPNYDRAYAIEVGRDGSVYIAGRAGPESPTTPGTIQPAFGGDLTAGANAAYGRQDGFIARLAPDGSRLLWATYFGGGDSAIIRDVDIDSSGNIYLSIDASTSADFPVTSTAFQPGHGGGADGAFVVLAADLTRMVYATYLGGRGQDGSREAALDRYGNYVCAGDTASPDFPLRNALDTALGGGNDGFVARFSPNSLGADLNADGIVDFRDFGLVAEQWLNLSDDSRVRSRASRP